MVGDGIRAAVHRHRLGRPLHRRERQARRGHGGLRSATSRPRPTRWCPRRRSSSTRSRTATSTRPRRSSRSRAPTRSGSSRSRSRSATSTRARRPRGRRARPGAAVDRLPPDREGPVGRPACSPTRGQIADQLVADTKDLQSRIPTLDLHARRARQRRQGAARRGRHRQDHRRGGPLLAHRPVGLPGQRRGRAGRGRGAAAGDRRQGQAARPDARRAVQAVDDAARAPTRSATASSSTPS